MIGDIRSRLSINPTQLEIIQPSTIIGRAKSEAMTLATNIKESLTPAFIIRMRNKARYTTRIVETEG